MPNIDCPKCGKNGLCTTTADNSDDVADIFCDKCGQYWRSK